VTWSQNSGHLKRLHAALSDALPKGRWRTAKIKGTDGLPDKHYFVYNDSKVMMGGSTAFQPSDDEQESLWSHGCTPSIARNLATLDKEALTWLCNVIPHANLREAGATPSSMVTHITQIPPEHWATIHPWIGRNVQVV
jgi:hypothetical protein